MDGELIRRNPKRTKAKLERLRKLAEKTGKKSLRRFPTDYQSGEYEEWTNFSHDNINYKEMPMIRGVGYLTQLFDWCNDNCKGYWLAKGGRFYFEQDDDAALFAMVWK